MSTDTIADADAPSADPATSAEPAAAEPAPAGEQPAAAEPAAEPAQSADAPAAKPAADARPRTLLEEADEPAAGDAPDDGVAGKAVDGEKLEAFKSSIRALDLGEGVRFDDAAFSDIAPELMEMAGGDPGRAEPLVRKYVQGEIARARAAQEAQDAFNAELRNQCRQRWGADTMSVAKAANAGGRAVFGDRIWNEMKGIESFANNPDIMERLAMVGKRLAVDGGAVHPAGQSAEDTRDVIARMYGGIK